MKKQTMIIILTVSLLGSFVWANEQEGKKPYHLDQYPKLGQMFDWGMQAEAIESALNQTLETLGGNKYHANVALDGLEWDASFIIADVGLEAIVLQVRMSPDQFYRNLDVLRAVYGEPTAVDTNNGAMQWKDGLNDTGIVNLGEQDGLYSVLVGLRKLRYNVTETRLNPGQISSLEGVVLGMSSESFLKQPTYFEAKKLPKEEGLPAGGEVYQASLTVNLTPSEAYFEFNQNKLTYIMIYLALESQEDADMHKEYEHHLAFLSNLYGPPAKTADRMVSWNDGAHELRFGLHPFGTYVISWELLDGMP